MRRYGLAGARRCSSSWRGSSSPRSAPLLSPYNPATVDVTARLRPPSSLHWLGTDVLGRDVFTRLIYGARISLTTGIVVVLVGAIIGTLVGGIAAYARGRARRADHAPDRPGAVLSADHPRDGDRGGARHRHDQHHHRHAGGVVAEIRAPRAQPRAGAALAGICRGRGRDGPEPRAHPDAPHHAQFDRAADRAGDARCRQRHHHLRRPLVPRPRRHSADARMGLDGVGGPRADRAMVGRGVSRASPS